MSDRRNKPEQLELLFHAQAPAEVSKAPAPTAPRAQLRVIKGGGQKKQEPLQSRDAVVRVLLEAGADLLLRRISPERAEEIEKRVDRALNLFDLVDSNPLMMKKLEAELDALEVLMRETRDRRPARRTL